MHLIVSKKGISNYKNTLQMTKYTTRKGLKSQNARRHSANCKPSCIQQKADKYHRPILISAAQHAAIAMTSSAWSLVTLSPHLYPNLTHPLPEKNV
jgi:hypothetical protein